MALSGYVVGIGSADRDKHLSGKRKGGGVCFMINNSWCNHNNIQELKSFCSPDLDFLTILAQANTKTALDELHSILCKPETMYPEAAFIVAGVFYKSNLRTMLPTFY